MDKVNIKDKLTSFDDHWSPKIIGELNGQYVKVGKLLGEFEWHHHDLEDELFLVISGTLLIKFRDREIELNEGEFLIIPKGTDHLPVAKEEVHILLFEPATTLNTGNITSNRTKKDLDRI